MTRFEWMISALAVILVAPVIAGCVYAGVQSFDNSYDGDSTPPWIILQQALGSFGSFLVMLGLACGVGLLFLRAANWVPTPDDDGVDRFSTNG